MQENLNHGHKENRNQNVLDIYNNFDEQERQLANILYKHFSYGSNLEYLIFGLIDRKLLRGAEIREKIVHLVALVAQSNNFFALINAIKDERPDIDWNIKYPDFELPNSYATPEYKFPKELFDLIFKHFGIGELTEIAFGMDIPWNSLAGNTISDKISSLLAETHRLGQLNILLDTLQEKRDFLDFEKYKIWG